MKALPVYIRSIASILFINTYIFLLNFFNKKIIFFYFPRENLTKKDQAYIEDLLDNIGDNYYVFFGHQLENLKKKNFFYVYEKLLKYIFKIDLFVTNYLCDEFPKKAARMYIHHCIYDSPLTDKKLEAETASRFSNYNFILLSSDFVVKYFDELINKFPESKKKSLNNKTKILATGYPRLDYLIKKSNKEEVVDSIIIAPANYVAYPEHTIIHDLDNIIKILLDNFKYNIIYRPHPGNRILKLNNDNISSNLAYQIGKKFEDNKRFTFDTSDNYLKNYFRSKFMISDLSGTSFTYSFLTLRPVLYFSPNEKIFKADHGKLNHFQDRDKIGIIAKNVNQILEKAKDITLKEKNYTNSIVSLRNRLKNIDNSKEVIHKKIKEILL